MITKRPIPSGTARSSRPTCRATLLGVALAAAALAGCQVDNTPTSYDDARVKTNFIDTCTGNVPPIDNTTTTLAARSVCECSFEAFKSSVPYNDESRTNATYAGYPSDKPNFVTLNNELRDNPGKINELPDAVKSKLDNCRTAAAAPGTTVAPAGPAVPTTTAAPTTTRAS